MSRAYRIKVKESISRQVKGSDEISTTLEVLEILPPEAMAELLRKGASRARLHGARGWHFRPPRRFHHDHRRSLFRRSDSEIRRVARCGTSR